MPVYCTVQHGPQVFEAVKGFVKFMNDSQCSCQLLAGNAFATDAEDVKTIFEQWVDSEYSLSVRLVEKKLSPKSTKKPGRSSFCKTGRLFGEFRTPVVASTYTSHHVLPPVQKYRPKHQHPDRRVKAQEFGHHYEQLVVATLQAHGGTYERVDWLTHPYDICGEGKCIEVKTCRAGAYPTFYIGLIDERGHAEEWVWPDTLKAGLTDIVVVDESTNRMYMYKAETFINRAKTLRLTESVNGSLGVKFPKESIEMGFYASYDLVEAP